MDGRSRSSRTTMRRRTRIWFRRHASWSSRSRPEWLSKVAMLRRGLSRRGWPGCAPIGIGCWASGTGSWRGTMNAMTQADGFEFVQAVAYLGPEYLLAVTWKDGQTEEVDLAPLVFRYRILRPLRNLDAFRRVAVDRSEERRVGKECVSTCRSRWWPYH